mgnify:CR=1 FL=1
MKKQITMIFIMALLFLIFDCDKSFADNYNTDDAIVYETDEIIANNVIVDKDVYIRKGVTLTIEKGCTVTFNGNVYIWGTLTNNGMILNNKTAYCLDYNGFMTAGGNYDYGYLKNNGTFKGGNLVVNAEYLSNKIPDKQNSTQTPEPTATAANPPTQTPEPTATATNPPTQTPEPTATAANPPTQTPEPTATVTNPPTQTPEPTATAANPPTQTPEPTATVTNSPTQTPEPTVTAANPPTQTPEPTATVTNPPTQQVADTVKNDDGNAGESVDKLNKKKARGVYINKRTIKIKNGKKYKVKVQRVGITKKLVYLSGNKKIATVNSKGIIKAKRRGHTFVTVKCGKYKAKVMVIVFKN